MCLLIKFTQRKYVTDEKCEIPPPPAFPLPRAGGSHRLQSDAGQLFSAGPQAPPGPASGLRPLSPGADFQPFLFVRRLVSARVFEPLEMPSDSGSVNSVRPSVGLSTAESRSGPRPHPRSVLPLCTCLCFPWNQPRTIAPAPSPRPLSPPPLGPALSPDF